MIFIQPKHNRKARSSFRFPVRLAAIMFAITILLCGCSSEWEETQTIPSPEGDYFIIITREYQPANDPEPFWQHISILRKEETNRSKKGNLFIYSGNTPPKIHWTGPRSLTIEMNDVSSSFEAPLNNRASSEISITATISRPAQAKITAGHTPAQDSSQHP